MINNVMSMKKWIQIAESVDYERNDTKVIATLKSYDSAAYTRLAKNLIKIQELKSEISELEKQVKQDRREQLADLFDATDAAFTRVVKTQQFIFTLSKDPKPTKTVKYKEVLNALAENLTPQLIVVLNALIEEYSSTTQTPPKLSVKPIDENQHTSAIDTILQWASTFDQQLEQLKSHVST